MTTMQKLELMKEIDRRNAQRVAEHIEAQADTNPTGKDAA